jgi:hypothetical protein
MIFPRNRTSSFPRKQLSRLHLRRQLMKTRALKIMDPTKLMVTGSNQKRLMRSQMKRKEMSLRLTLIVAMLRIYQRIQALSIHHPVPPPNLVKLVRPNNLPMILKVCLKLRLVVQN